MISSVYTLWTLKSLATGSAVRNGLLKSCVYCSMRNPRFISKVCCMCGNPHYVPAPTQQVRFTHNGQILEANVVRYNDAFYEIVGGKMDGGLVHVFSIVKEKAQA